MTLKQDNPIPPKGCICGTLWTVRSKHGKPDCPYIDDNPLSDKVEAEIDNLLLELRLRLNNANNSEARKATEQTKSKLTKLLLEQRIKTIDDVFSLSPKGLFNNWKPMDAFRFYERLKAYEKDLQARLNQLDKEKP